MVQPDVFIGADPYLNSPVTCDVFPRVNIELWKTDSPALQVISMNLIVIQITNFGLKVPEAILIQTLEKGTEGLVMRRKEEWHLWQNSEFILLTQGYSLSRFFSRHGSQP